MIDVSFPDCLGRSVRATRQTDVRMTCGVIKATRWHVRPHTHAPPSAQCMWGSLLTGTRALASSGGWWGCLGDLEREKERCPPLGLDLPDIHYQVPTGTPHE